MKKMLIDAPETCDDCIFSEDECWPVRCRRPGYSFSGQVVCKGTVERPEACRALDVDVDALKKYFQ